MKIQLLFILVVLVTAPLIWTAHKKWRGRIMMAATLLAWLFVAPFSLLLMVAVALGQWLVLKGRKSTTSKWRYLVSIILPLVPLVFYKLEHKAQDWIIPLGLSYYAFRQMHVAFEYYKGELPSFSLEEYFQYLLFLPVILIGPIHRINDMQRSWRRLKWQPAVFSDGLERILYGLVKINFLGNYLFSGKCNQWIQHIDMPGMKYYLKMMAFAGNAYVQFAGFSDLAIGMGLLWGIRVMENFNFPFLATNMQDFWTRWHISLSSWCRDYIFQPIMAYSRNRWFALVAAMLVLALWHEISWRYISWGVFHSCLIVSTVAIRRNFPAFSDYINKSSSGKWIGRLWVLHAFAFSCLFLIVEDASAFSNALKSFFNNV